MLSCFLEADAAESSLGIENDSIKLESKGDPKAEALIQGRTTAAPTLVAPTKFEDLFRSPPKVRLDGKEKKVISINDFKAKNKGQKPMGMKDRLFMNIPGLSSLVNGMKRPRKRPPKKKPFTKIQPVQATTQLPPVVTQRPFRPSDSSPTLLELQSTPGPPPPPSRLPPPKTTTITPTFQTTTFANLIEQSLGDVRTLDHRDKMKAARNRLRELMGQRPIGLKSTSSPQFVGNTKESKKHIENARLNILHQLEDDKIREIDEATASLNPSVTVTVKSTIGGLDPMTTTAPKIITQPSAPSPTKGQEFVKKKLNKIKKKGKKPALEFSVLGGPNQMRDTLMQLLKKKDFQFDIGDNETPPVIVLQPEVEENEESGVAPFDPGFELSDFNDEELIEIIAPILEETTTQTSTTTSTEQKTEKPVRKIVFSSDLKLKPDPIENIKLPPRHQQGIKDASANLELPDERPNADDPVHEFDLPSSRLKPSFDADKVLSAPNKRQNPFLRLLRFNNRERTLRKGLRPPDFNKSPIFRQIVRTPQKYRNEFLDLPPKDQDKVFEILRRYGGDNFNANALLVPPSESPERVGFTPVFHTTEAFSSGGKRRFRPIRPSQNLRKTTETSTLTTTTETTEPITEETRSFSEGTYVVNQKRFKVFNYKQKIKRPVTFLTNSMHFCRIA